INLGNEDIQSLEAADAMQKAELTSLRQPDVWQDVKKRFVTKPADTSVANDSTVDQDLNNTVVEHKCSNDEGSFPTFSWSDNTSAISISDLLKKCRGALTRIGHYTVPKEMEEVCQWLNARLAA
ncbi:hypothetical protein Tco_1128077, partial [Tanacetum coccineum]